ncbi:MAG: DUF5683 domain-containing protein [candidate division WOR-3 bacterium]|nr:DUF5683 domain-containing protein [candidate division WOR-3 bacterium]
MNSIICCGLFAHLPQDTLKKETQPTKHRQQIYYKSSSKAMFLSAIFPGGGQFYTQNYLKGVFVAGVEGALVSYAIKNHLDYKNTNNAEFRNRATNLLWWLALVKIFSLADAYVSANMFKFKEQQKLTVKHQIYESVLKSAIPSDGSKIICSRQHLLHLSNRYVYEKKTLIQSK